MPRTTKARSASATYAGYVGRRAATLMRQRASRQRARSRMQQQSYKKNILPLLRREKEVKYFDEFTQDMTVTLAGDVLDVNLIPEGTDINERVGRRCKMISWRGKIRAIIDGAAAVQAFEPGITRVIWFVDYKTRGATPTVADLLAAGGVTDVYALPNLNEKERFRILKDKTYVFGGHETAVGPVYDYTKTVGPTIYNDDWYIKLDVETVFGGAASAIASLEQGSLHILVIGSSANAYKCDVMSRVAYID